LGLVQIYIDSNIMALFETGLLLEDKLYTNRLYNSEG
jgi:hypothetical protein